ncbi:MAG: tetratricopeptide repeat protein [Nitrospirae bacterium]|nr:tetratricopeptide repeat protein [Nitrospirota bacterium]
MIGLLKKFTELLNKKIFQILLIILVGFTAYSTSFTVPLIFDDEALSDVINDFGRGHIIGTRYLSNLTFYINYKLHEFNIPGYRITNILIHIVNSFLLYWLLVYLFKAHQKSPEEPTNSTPTHKRYIPFLVALLFVSHPMQQQAVTLIIQRTTLLATLFYLLTLISYIKWRFLNLNEKPIKHPSIKVKHKDKKPHSIKSYLYYLLTLFIAIAASLTKEIIVTLPVIITLTEFAFFSGKPFKRLLKCLPFFVIIPIIFLSSSGYWERVNNKPLENISNAYVVNQSNSIVANETSEPAADLSVNNVHNVTSSPIALGWRQNLFTQFGVLLTYIRMLFFPINLTLIYDYPVSLTFWEPRVYLSFIVLLAIFVFAAYLYNKTRNGQCKKSRDLLFISFGVLWFFTAISPQSSIIPLSNWMLLEYRVYLASIGFFIAIVTALFMLISVKTSEKLTAYLAIFLVILSLTFTAMTYNRNRIWQSPITLYEDNIKKLPTSIFAHINLGVAYFNELEYDKAIAEFKEAKSLNPLFGLTHYPLTRDNLVSTYIKKGKYEDAIKELNESLIYEPNDTEAHIRLGLLYVNQKRIDDAVKSFKKATALNSSLVMPRYYLGLVYVDLDRFEEAIHEFRSAALLNPKLGRIYVALGDTFLKQKKLEEALVEYEKGQAITQDKPDPTMFLRLCDVYKMLGREVESSSACKTALEYNSKNISEHIVHFKLGEIHEQQGNLTDAATEYSMAIELNPNYAEAHNNLGVVYGKQGKLDDALKEIDKALSIKPDYADAHSNLGLCLRLQGKIEQAKQEFTTALKLDPNHAGAQRNLSTLK